MRKSRLLGIVVVGLVLAPVVFTIAYQLVEGRLSISQRNWIDSRIPWRISYAWPSSYDHSGIRTFFIDDSGDIFGTDDARYSGTGHGPAPNAATGRSAPPNPAFTGADGNVWKQIN